MSLDILYEDNHLLAVNKPAGVATAHEAGSLLDRAKSYLQTKYQKPGNVYLGLVHRLDKPVSGLVLFARTSKAAARLSEQFREHTVQKTYLALSEQPPRSARSQGWSYEDHALMEDYLWHDDQSRIVRIVAAHHAGAQHARTEYRIREHSDWCLLELKPQTGRRHQLRVQLASRGAPILGDKKYGSRVAFAGIALHAWSLTFAHPIGGERQMLTAPLPASWGKIRTA